jgi:UPF0755 protein
MSRRRTSKAGRKVGLRRKHSNKAGRPDKSERTRPIRSLLRRAGVWVAFGVVLLACVGSIWLFVLYPLQRGPGRGRAVQLVVPRAAGPALLAKVLAEEGAIASSRVFSLWLRLHGGAREVVEGLHLVSDDLSPAELLAALERQGGGRSVRVTFPEGWTRFDMARRLQEKRVVSLRAFLDATMDPALLHELGIDAATGEGYLFPATYEFAVDSDAAQVVRRMKGEFDRRWDLLSNAYMVTKGESLPATLDQRDVVTLASMVEKEAAVDDERAIIADVFLNRLRDPAFHPKHLECDPTAAYGCLTQPESAASCAQYAGKPTAAIEHDPDNPYSTYTHEGLPPGPIANPGDKSLAAVMNPTPTRYFYFVARGEGRHVFSETYDAHLTAVRNTTRSP